MTAIHAAAAYMFLHASEPLYSVVGALKRMGNTRQEIAAAYVLYVQRGGL